ncbi:MAG: hypothetical protein SAJ12_23170 [Jaaginema sp. PMC 1079.18]|nr:hypothetical protein [Jaaginema sp. PMC 1080.18]MEC4853893.1 hypothetical protein [Jaaginema sp. PMC 1079.18]MEC4865010.1 hypothetical protein [Jaaginema sp. PMC 1078.18]
MKTSNRFFTTLTLCTSLILASTSASEAQRNWGWFRCEVTGIQRGQLAVRPEPAGEPFAGLNNGNTVAAMIGSGRWVALDNVVWYYVHILRGPNSGLNGREGWVNSDYLECYEELNVDF